MAYDNYQTLNVAVEGGVATATLDHGEINLLDTAMLADLDRLGQEVEADEAVRVLVLQSANPDFFIAHADLDAISALTPESGAETLAWIHGVFDRFRAMPKVTIAKIAGRCRGGGSELVLAFDMRFAVLGRAVLCQPEVGVGLVPGAGGTVRLPRLVGRARALEVILGCGDIPADVAERYGYVNRALPAAEIDYFVSSLATRIASFPAEAIAAAKAAVQQTGTIEDGLAHETQAFLTSVNSDAAKRRMAAALGMGMQTPVIEKCCFTHIWGPLAGV